MCNKIETVYVIIVLIVVFSEYNQGLRKIYFHYKATSP